MSISRLVVVVVGRLNVGKFIIFNKFVGKRILIVENIFGVIRDRIFVEVEWLDKYFILVDIGGIEFDSEDIILF